MAKTIVITSGKGGVGKTTVCYNLGYALATKKLKVLLVDVDLGLNNLDVVMGIENKIVYDIFDVLEGKCRAKQALIQDFFQSNLYILPSTHIYSSVKADAEDINKVLLELADYFDYILLDCPAGIEMGFIRAISLAEESIVVTTPHISAVRDADKVIGILQNFNINKNYLIINRARGDLMVTGDMLSTEIIESYLNVQLLGVVPEDDIFSSQLLLGGVGNKKTPAHISFQMIANKLQTGSGADYDCTKKYKGFIGSFRRSIKRRV